MEAVQSSSRQYSVNGHWTYGCFILMLRYVQCEGSLSLKNIGGKSTCITRGLRNTFISLIATSFPFAQVTYLYSKHFRNWCKDVHKCYLITFFILRWKNYAKMSILSVTKHNNFPTSSIFSLNACRLVAWKQTNHQQIIILLLKHFRKN